MKERVPKSKELDFAHENVQATLERTKDMAGKNQNIDNFSYSPLLTDEEGDVPKKLNLQKPDSQPLPAVTKKTTPATEPESETEKEEGISRTPLLRLFIKNGEYAYARPDDIVMIESSDHIVRVYILFGDKIKKVIRNNTLKEFLSQLPADKFLRINRFCAINSSRLSGGSYNEQSFEFDFRITIKLKHTIPQKLFNAIGK